MTPTSPDEDLMRELRYCRGAPGARHKGGQIGRAQDRALAEGLLEAHPASPNYLTLTAAGQVALDEAAA